MEANSRGIYSRDLAFSFPYLAIPYVLPETLYHLEGNPIHSLHSFSYFKIILHLPCRDHDLTRSTEPLLPRPLLVINNILQHKHGLHKHKLFHLRTNTHLILLRKLMDPQFQHLRRNITTISRPSNIMRLLSLHNIVVLAIRLLLVTNMAHQLDLLNLVTKDTLCLSNPMRLLLLHTNLRQTTTLQVQVTIPIFNPHQTRSLTNLGMVLKTDRAQILVDNSEIALASRENSLALPVSIPSASYLNNTSNRKPNGSQSTTPPRDLKVSKINQQLRLRF